LIYGSKCLGCIEVANKLSSFTSNEYNLINSLAKELAQGVLSPCVRVESEEIPSEQIADEDLLNPLLRNVLIILAETVKCEKQS
jgi:hypothetical protein